MAVKYSNVMARVRTTSLRLSKPPRPLKLDPGASTWAGIKRHTSNIITSRHTSTPICGQRQPWARPIQAPSGTPIT